MVRFSILFTWGALALAAAATRPASAGGPPADIAALVESLGAPSSFERERAQALLRLRGEAARECLEAARECPDPEKRSRIATLLRELKRDALWAPTRVRCEALAEHASVVLTSFAEQTGNRIKLADETDGRPFHKAFVAPVFRDVPFWQAVDEVCQESGNRITRAVSNNQASILIVAATSPAIPPIAYAGQFRACITSARRRYEESLTYETAQSDIAHTFQLGIHIAWEDRLRLVACGSQLEVTAAVTDMGRTLWQLPDERGPAGLPMWTTQRYVHGLGGPFTVRLQPPTLKEKKLDRLRLTWPVIAVGEITTLDITDLHAPEPVRQDDMTVVVELFKELSPRCFQIVLLIERELPAPGPREVLLCENECSLFDGAGHPLTLVTRPDGALTDTGVRVRWDFASQPENGPPERLQLRYPRLRDQRSIGLEFTDVPLPMISP